MRNRLRLRFKSALIAGATAGVFAPLLWPFVVWAVQGHISDWQSLLSGLLTVAGFALILGPAVSLIVGVPLLSLLDRLNLERPPVVVTAGALLGTVTVSNFMSWPLSLWPLYLYLLVLGGLCGFVAVRVMDSHTAAIGRTNRSLVNR